MASAKPKLLFLAHLLPWPLHGGGQIKSYHTLKCLAAHFDITLLAFVRQEADRQNVEPLMPLCVDVIQTVLLKRGPWQNLAAAVRAAVTGGSLFIERDASSAMQTAVLSALQADLFTAIHADHLQMMAFVPASGPDAPFPKIVLDQHNVEHHLLRQFAESGQGASPFLRLIARWDWSRLQRFEKIACRRADRVLAVSDEDACAFTELMGEAEASGKVHVTPIGVDVDYFSPALDSTGAFSPCLCDGSAAMRPPGANEKQSNSYSARRAHGRRPHRVPARRVVGLKASGSLAIGEPNVVENSPASILSVGTMYWPPNVDAVRWFSTEILPLVRQDFPNAVFQIVGARPTPRVFALADAQPNAVTVTGTVPDVRPYMAACGVFVVPLRAGSGMRVKILQAMAMGTADSLHDPGRGRDNGNERGEHSAGGHPTGFRGRGYPRFDRRLARETSGRVCA